ncbi:MAG TPA: transcription antitermination factor NusB [Saprospiraceae bacterium]|nr:transcription antitermination factor NusB [Saprospiraceae bacterium]MCB9268624.1 transcription antitermination factor NusB [Lewinellaceae bacterium]HPG05788.1 transcription antitermination factor NusB [Saprospiraceae bacterium]HPR01678.1 transcription antitermination factor NusB [Saprospiraceae bacterium]HRV85616.1 transcription antitermination factor NusB [Saprospiraceae bacterium]
MLSRRNIRVKVMQALYALNRDEELTIAQALRAYEISTENSFVLYLFNIYTLLQICRFAKVDAQKRHAKYLPSEEDLKFTDKFYTNALIQSLVKHIQLQKKIKDLHFETRMDQDLIRKMYKDFSNEEVYRAYIQKEVNAEEDHVDILHELYRFIRRSEVFNEMVEDLYATWEDDKSLVVGAVKKTLKALPAASDFLEEYQVQSETYQFGIQLLNRTAQDDTKIQEIFEPTLKNWDVERLALIDTILIKMAIAEFLYFKSIPTKVTLNEYVEVSKQYSTAKSKDFINGILDKVMKQLQEDGLIKKEGRGLLD